MSVTAFIGLTPSERPQSKLAGDNKHLLDYIRPEVIESLKEERQKYLDNYAKADEAIREVGKNNRIKNKHVDYKVMAEREKNYFNFRSVDFYLFRLGIEPRWNRDFKEGVEYELAELRQHTENMLFMLNEYHGYQSIHWWLSDGSTNWFNDGEPDFPEKDAYLLEELGIIYL